MVNKKKKKNSEIADFLHETGFILELETCEFLEKQGYAVDPSQYFFDAEEGKKREIDLIATKVVNKIAICLIIECKQNLGDDWVFICTQKNPEHYYNELKHSPKIPLESLKEKAYDNLHIYNFRFALAQNYLAYRSEKGKKFKVEPIQIKESIYKLPKTVVWVARDVAKIRTIYLPVTLFNGKIFVASYDKELIVKEKTFVQFQTTLETPAYHQKFNPSFSKFITVKEGDNELDPDCKKARSSAERLGKFYVIDFITRKGLKKYLNLIEKEVSLLDLKLWPGNKES